MDTWPNLLDLVEKKVNTFFSIKFYLITKVELKIYIEASSGQTQSSNYILFDFIRERLCTERNYPNYTNVSLLYPNKLYNSVEIK